MRSQQDYIEEMVSRTSCGYEQALVIGNVTMEAFHCHDGFARGCTIISHVFTHAQAQKPVRIEHRAQYGALMSDAPNRLENIIEELLFTGKAVEGSFHDYTHLEG